MRLQKQPNGWSCLPTAFAILLEVDVEKIFKFLEHDGSKIIWPNLNDPWCRRSFHIQEMINFCLTSGYAVTTVTPKIGLSTLQSDDVKLYENGMFDYCTKFYNGVLTGVIENQLPHAIVWYGNTAYDPTSGELFCGDMVFHRFHIVQKAI